MESLPEALHGLAAYNQFIVYRTEPDPKKPGKLQKFPLNPREGYKADPHEPANQMSFEDARAAAARLGGQIGYVFTAADPFFFLDIDSCNNGGTWSQLAQDLCRTFSGCAVEVSVSGRGLHIFGTLSAPQLHGCKNVALGLELYTSGRFVALTGLHASGDVRAVADDAFRWLVATHFSSAADAASTEWTDGPVGEWNGPENDDQLLAKMLNAQSAGAAFGNRATVRQLWTNDVEALARCYPGDSDDGIDRSSADAALCQHLAFWTGKDCARIERLFERSELVRDKWTDREDYRRRTIINAVARCENVYSAGTPRNDTAENVESARTGFQYMSVEQQIKHFAGCVYVRDPHAVIVPDGGLLKPEQFRVEYGGYSFAADTIGARETRNAWEVFTESQAYSFPKAHSFCFRPEVPPGAFIEEEGRRLVNAYVPIDTPSRPGDVTPFLELLRAQLPEDHDREILLAYMAACVQHTGVKFQWAPLIQAVQGNGKTFILKCLEHAVGRRYTHWPNASDLSGNGLKFTAWLVNKLLICVEEIYTAERADVIEALKDKITSDRIEIQGKAKDQNMYDNRANFIFGSNHKDAIRKAQSDRRYAPFFMAQQTVEDLVREGWESPKGGPTPYFPNLYKWAREGGFEYIAHFLKTYEIPDALNPATMCQRAPITTSTGEALQISLGRIEQEILEAVEEGRVGFCGGWISSTAVDRLLEERRDEKRIPPNKRRDMMQSIGYDLHPALSGGRVNTASPIDGGKKPRLYIKKNGMLAQLTDPAVILQRYIDAQQGGGDSSGVGAAFAMSRQA